MFSLKQFEVGVCHGRERKCEFFFPFPSLPDEFFSAVHQAECIFTMVTIIAGPHCTLEGPDLLPYYPCILVF